MRIKVNRTYTLEVSEQELEVLQILVGHCLLGNNRHLKSLSDILDIDDNEIDYDKLTFAADEVGDLEISIKE